MNTRLVFVVHKQWPCTLAFDCRSPVALSSELPPFLCEKLCPITYRLIAFQLVFWFHIGMVFGGVFNSGSVVFCIPNYCRRAFFSPLEKGFIDSTDLLVFILFSSPFACVIIMNVTPKRQTHWLLIWARRMSTRLLTWNESRVRRRFWVHKGWIECIGEFFELMGSMMEKYGCVSMLPLT